jgi:nitrogen regulatory protein PII 2
MKEIYSIIQPRRVQATKDALAAAGIYSLNAFPCMGHGRGQIEPAIVKAAFDGNEEALAVLGQHPPLIPMRTVSLVVPDAQAEAAVAAILQANRTGQHGDGKIYVCETRDAVRIRTGETGDSAL